MKRRTRFVFKSLEFVPVKPEKLQLHKHFKCFLLPSSAHYFPRGVLVASWREGGVRSASITARRGGFPVVAAFVWSASTPSAAPEIAGRTRMILTSSPLLRCVAGVGWACRGLTVERNERSVREGESGRRNIEMSISTISQTLPGNFYFCTLSVCKSSGSPDSAQLDWNDR